MRSSLIGLFAFMARLVNAALLIPRQEDGVFRVTKPALGDAISLPQYNFYPAPDWTFNIEWDVVPSIADQPVIITLFNGNNLTTARNWGVIQSSATNNGTYTISSRDSDAWSWASSESFPSACNYTFGLKVWNYAVYSDFFAIINAGDGGLRNGVPCPSDLGLSNIEQNSVTVQGGSSGTISSPSPSSSSATGGSSNTDTSNTASSGSSGISSTKLIVAIVVPIVVLLLAFAVIIFLGIRRGWFLTKSQKHTLALGGAPPIGREPSEYWGKYSRKDGNGGITKPPEVGEMNGRVYPSELQSPVTGPNRVELQ